MSKFSVKKPLTVFVAVIAILVLGVVAYFKMTPDLLPNMDFPYVLIMTTYPGASPEKVEQEITKPMEQAMSTLDHIQEVSSASNENVSMVILEFTEGVNMDTVGVDIQQEITQLSADWSDTVGTPYVLKINPSMLPVEVAAVSMEGMDTMELTDFLNDKLMNQLEGIPGVARITTSGAVEQQLHVVLDQKLIDKLNDRIAAAINGELDDAADELNEKKEELEDAQKQVDSAQSQLNAGVNALIQGENQLNQKKTELTAMEAQLRQQLEQAQEGRKQLQITYTALNELNNQVNNLVSARQDAYDHLNTLQSLSDRIAALDARETALSRLKQDNEALAGEIQALQEKIQAMDPADESLPELNAQLAEKESTYSSNLLAIAQEEAALSVDRAACEEALAEAGVTEETLPGAIALARTAAAAADTAVEQIDALLASQGTDRDGLATSVAELKAQLDALDEGIAELEKALTDLENGMLSLDEAQQLLNQQKTAGMLQLSVGAAKLAVSSATISQGLTQIESGLDTVESSREEALDKADLNNIVTMEMVSQILAAQNFSMPAGYVEQDGVKYMVSVGDEITDIETLENLLLFDPGIDGIDPVYLKDVAVVTLTDNRDETYAKLNGQDGIVLSFEKQSTYATAETTNNIASRFRSLEQEYPGLSFVSLMNQGDYIYLIVDTILNSLLLGAVFAIVVLYLFLRDLRPTFITLCSIPISVIFAIVLMYFTGVTINMISLSGLAVAVGMLVDNSVVVIENIYRLRSRGVPAARAAVQGTKQVGMSVVASTLTSVCVFLPVVFSASIVRSLMMPMSLCIGYCLMASLIVAVTVVPAAASTVLKKAEPKRLVWFEKVQDKYAHSLEWCLQHRALPLIAAVALLAFSGWQVFSMGVELLPSITSNEAQITLTTADGLSQEESYAIAGQVAEAAMNVDNVTEVGVTLDTTISGLDISQLGLPSTITDILSAANAYGTYKINVMLDESLSSKEVEQTRQAMEDAIAQIENCTAEVKLYGMTDDLTSQLATGLSIKIYGSDTEAMTTVSEKVMEIINNTDGFTNADNGLGNGDATIILKVDRDKVRAYGLTVGQVYQQIAAKLTTTTTSKTPVTIDGTTMNVEISNNLDPVTKENMMDLTFETTEMAADGTVSTGTCTLNDIATWSVGTAPDAITSDNQTRYFTVTADTEKGYNTTVQSRVLQEKLNEYINSGEMPENCSISLGGETESTDYMVNEMVQWMALALPFVYLVMVAQFQSLLSPFIVLFTVPLAFTGGLLGLLFTGQQLTMISLMGFIVLMGTVVNNGIVFVDYANQLRMGGMERRAALVATGKTRMRPILMTTLTTVLAMLQLVFSGDMASQLMSGMAIVIICGLSYATLMTLYIVPILYDILFKKPPLNVDVGSDSDLDDIPDDAAEFIAAQSSAAAQPEA